jgi:hypothetical protein
MSYGPTVKLSGGNDKIHKRPESSKEVLEKGFEPETFRNEV